MLNKPKFMSPSVNMYGNSVIDLNSDILPFSCIVDGNESVVAWQIVVSTLKDNGIVFDTGKEKLDTPFYPINNRNQNVTFSKNLKNYFESAKINKGFINCTEPYYWNITLWGKTGTVIYSAEEVFYANSIPTADIYYSYNNKDLDSNLILLENENDASIINRRKIFLKADYKQEENVAIKKYGWRLIDTDNDFIIIDTITQNQIYGVEDDISCECNGLTNNSNYSIELYAETQNGYFGIIKKLEFNVSYNIKDIDIDFDIKPLDSSSGIMLNWGNLKTTEGVVVGDDVEYKKNLPITDSVSVRIPEDSKIVFEGTANGKQLKIDENAYVVLSFQIEKDTSLTIFDISGEDNVSNIITRTLYYNNENNSLEYIVTRGASAFVDTVTLTNTENIHGQRCWYIATLYPLLSINGSLGTKLTVSENYASNSTLPSNEFYPSDNTYPYLGDWGKNGEG